MDMLHITQLKLPATIGAYAWEQQITRSLTFDIKLAVDNKKAAENDCLDDAINYAMLADLLSQWLQQHQFQLIETVAEQAAQLLLDKLPIKWIEMCVSKPHPMANMTRVSMTIQRNAPESS